MLKQGVEGTSLTADEFYGRNPAPGIDLDLATTDAAVLCHQAMAWIVNNKTYYGAYMMRVATTKLALVYGNLSVAERALGGRIKTVTPGTELSGELERGMAREHFHPQLLADLQEMQEKARKNKPY